MVKTATSVQVRFWQGVIEPASAEPVRVGDNVLVEQTLWLSKAYKLVTGLLWQLVPSSPRMFENVVVAGVPARIIKEIDEKTQQKQLGRCPAQPLSLT